MRGLTLCAAAAALLLPRGGATSGSTQVHDTGRYYFIELATPSMIFRDPADEQEFHRSARAELEAKLAAQKKNIERNVATLRREHKLIVYQGDLPLLSEQALDGAKGACRMSFPLSFPDLGSLELTFAAPPSKKTWEAVAARVTQLFTREEMKP